MKQLDQHPENQLQELRQFASQRGFQIVQEYIDHGFSGTRARRPALDELMEDARATQIRCPDGLVNRPLCERVRAGMRRAML